MKCGNASCSAGNSPTLLEDLIIGSSNSVAVAPDGLPVIAYSHGVTGSLEVVKCSSAACR